MYFLNIFICFSYEFVNFLNNFFNFLKNFFNVLKNLFIKEHKKISRKKINKLKKQVQVQENFAWLVIAAFLLAVIIYSLPLSVPYP